MLPKLFIALLLSTTLFPALHGQDLHIARKNKIKVFSPGDKLKVGFIEYVSADSLLVQTTTVVGELRMASSDSLHFLVYDQLVEKEHADSIVQQHHHHFDDPRHMAFPTQQLWLLAAIPTKGQQALAIGHGAANIGLTGAGIVMVLRSDQPDGESLSQQRLRQGAGLIAAGFVSTLISCFTTLHIRKYRLHDPCNCHCDDDALWRVVN